MLPKEVENKKKKNQKKEDENHLVLSQIKKAEAGFFCETAVNNISNKYSKYVDVSGS